jgi:hypothetical protein
MRTEELIQECKDEIRLIPLMQSEWAGDGGTVG